MSLAWPLLAGLLLGAALAWLAGRRRAALPHACALCGKSARDVEALVVARRGAVCASCLIDGLSSLDVAGAGERRGLSAWGRALEQLLARLDPKAPRARSGALISAALALSDEDPEAYRRLALLAFRLDNPAAADEALARIPAASLAPRDRILRANALGRTGQPARGLEQLEAVDAVALGDLERGLLLAGVAWLELKAHPDLASEALAQHRTVAEQAASLLAAHAARTAGADRDRSAANPARAACALRAGDPARAVWLLQEADAPGGTLGAEELVLLGDAHAANGDRDAALSAWRRAIEKAHPDGIEARSARERLARAS